MIKIKEMGMMPRLGAIQPDPVVPVAPRSALPIARASDGRQRRRKGDRHFES
jgi:hypothetical protein